MSDQPKDLASTQKSSGLTLKDVLIKKNDALIKEVAEDLPIHLGEGEFNRTMEASWIQVITKHAIIRKCTTDCPVRDMCKWIVGQAPENYPDVRKMRCLPEAQTWLNEFKSITQMIQSKDHTGAELTDLEIGLCADYAMKKVHQLRAEQDMAASPSTVVDAVVPGTEGMTAEQLNPRLEAYDKAAKNAQRSLEYINKVVDERLKSVKEDQSAYLDAMTRIHKDMTDNPHKYANTNLAQYMTRMTERIALNQEVRAERFVEAKKVEKDAESSGD